MKSAGIQSKMTKRFIVTTNSKNTLSPASDRLKRNFFTVKPNQKWVSDTTFIRTRQGWLYLAMILDLYSRQVIGWGMSDRNNTKLVVDALQMAAVRRDCSEQAVVVHSDQGSTYASGDYQRLRRAFLVHLKLNWSTTKITGLENKLNKAYLNISKYFTIDNEGIRI